MLLGRSHAMSRRWQAAVDAFTAALAADPDNHETLDRRGTAYRQLDQYAAALADFSRAIELSPDDASYHRHRGSVLRDMGRLREAVAAYDRAIELRGDYETAYNSRALAFVDLAEIGRAVDDFSRSLEISPGDPVVLANRASAYASTGRWPEAIEDYTAALERDEDDVDALGKLAIAQGAGDDTAGYRETCARLLSAARANESEAALCVWPIVFAPDAGVDFTECVAAVHRGLIVDAAMSRDAVARRHAILGAALYRDGKLEEAEEQLALALEAFGDGDEKHRFSPSEADVLRLAALVADVQGKAAEANAYAMRAKNADNAADAAGASTQGAAVRRWHVAAVSKRLRREVEAKLGGGE
jgi:tetratricopeptide (TPR) repeat protein